MSSRPACLRCRRLALAGLLLLACAQGAWAETWKFLVYGDSRAKWGGGVNVEILSDLAAATVREKPDLVLFTGDLAGVGSPANYATWQRVMQPVYDAHIPVFPVAGNHEVPDLAAFKATLLDPLAAGPALGVQGFVMDTSQADGRSYAFRYRGVLFLALDEYGSKYRVMTHAVNQPFVDEQLAGRDPAVTPLVFAFGHEPAFRAGRDEGLEENPNERNAFWRSLENAGCTSYFCGHMHLYAHTRISPNFWNFTSPDHEVHQVISGAAGAPLYKLAYEGDTGPWTVVPLGQDTEHWGYVRVTVDDQTQAVTQTWVRRVAPGTFEDVPDSAFSYTATSGRRLRLCLAGGGLILAGAGVLLLVRRRMRRRSPPTTDNGQRTGQP